MIVAAGIIPLALAIILPRIVYPGRPGTATQTAAALPVERAAPIRATSAEAPNPQAAKLSPPAGAAAPDEAAVVSPPPAPPGPDAIYRRGKQRRAKGDYIAAVCDFDEVLRTNRMGELKEAVIDISLAAELTQGAAGRDEGAPADLAKKANQWLDELLEHATRLIRSRRYQAAGRGA